MANLQQALDALQPYVIGIRYLEGVPVVDAVFKDGWTLPESENIKKVKGNEELNYYMIFSERDGIGLDELLDYVDVVIKANIEREKKHELLKEKANELKEIFKKHSLVKLKRLRFSFSEEELVPDLNDFDIDEEITKEEIKTEVPNFVSPENTIEQTTNEIVATQDTYASNMGEYDDDDAELVAEEQRADTFRKIQAANKINGEKKKLASKIELPPRRNIQEAVGDIPDCDCGPDEACGKCIAYKDL